MTHHTNLRNQINRLHSQWVHARDSGLEPHPNWKRYVREWKAAINALAVARHYGV